MPFEVTPAHAEIFRWVASPWSRSLIIAATAGSGKSTTLIEILRRLPLSSSAMFLAFNKSAAAEVKTKAERAGLTRKGVDFRTLNSLGMRGIVGAFGHGVRVDDAVTRGRARSKLGPGETKHVLPAAMKLIAAAKSQGLVPDGVGARRRLLADTPESWAGLIERFDIQDPDGQPRLMTRALAVAREALVEGLRDRSAIDYDDQLYMTFAFDLALPRVDWLLVDEAMDLNPVMRSILGRAITDGGHLIAVGDAFQSINGWNGADVDSLGAIGRVYRADTLPLSTTYRCPTSHVELCQQWVPHFTAMDGAPEGTIETAEGDSTVDEIDWRADDLIVCRLNAPLISLAYRLIKRRVKVRMLGRDIGAGLLALMRKLEPRDVADLLWKLAGYQRDEEERIAKRYPDDEAKLEALRDRLQCLRELAAGAASLEAIVELINELFRETTDARLTLSSVHRAKGREAPRVFVLDPWRMPGHARTADQRQQEANLQYVAHSRARETLVLLTVDVAAREEALRKRRERAAKRALMQLGEVMA